MTSFFQTFFVPARYTAGLIVHDATGGPSNEAKMYWLKLWNSARKSSFSGKTPGARPLPASCAGRETVPEEAHHVRHEAQVRENTLGQS